MSDTNRVGIRAVVEVTFGVVPTAPSLRDLCITGLPSLAFTPETTVSEKIRSDRQIDDTPLVGGEAGGDINSELSADVQDFLLEGAFFSSFQSRVNRINDEDAASITAATATEFTVLDVGSTLPLVNDILRGQGFSVAANNAFHIVDGVPSATAFTTDSAVVEATPPLQARLHVVGHRGATADLDLAISGSTGTLTSTVLDLTTLGITIGDWVCLDGWVAEPNDNGFYRVSLAPAATLLTFDIVPVGAVTESGSGLDIDIYLGDRLINGVTEQSYSFEEHFDDHSPVTFQYFRGMTIDSLVITAPSQSIVTMAYTFAGKDAFFSDSGDPASVPDQLPAVTSGRVASATTITAIPVNVVNSSSNVARISRGGVPIAGANFVLEATIEIQNNLRQQNAVGNLGSIGVGVGEFSVSGSLNTYFDDSSLARDVIANTETSLDFRFEDSNSQAILIDLPRVKFTEGAPDVPSKNEDVTLPLAYQAIRQSTFDYTILWQRFRGFVKTT